MVCSAAVVIAYLMATRGWTYAASRTFLEEVRPIIEPNEGFISQLMKYELELNGDI